MTKKYAQEEAYILAVISNENYSQQELTTEKEKLQFLYDTFIAEYGWHIKRYGMQKALCEWLQGLPSAINIAFYNHDIIALAKQWGSLPENATERQEDKIIDRYFVFMAVRILNLWHRHKIA